MLDYEWGNGSPYSIMLAADPLPEPNRPVFHPYPQTSYTFNPEAAHFAATQNFPINPNPNAHFAAFPDVYKTGSVSYYQQPVSMLALEPAGQAGLVMVPKSEPVIGGYEFKPEFNSRIGLNLGGRTYFASADQGEFVNRVYLRSRGIEPGSVNSPRCQVEGCGADLSHAKHYHRRHKVCEFHSKAATVVAAGLTQRFCQQCSRFHLLSEFDNGKRSCRRRLADHNRRRRKSNQTNQDNIKSQIINNSCSPNPSSEALRTPPPPPPPYSGAQVTVAISPPDCSNNTGCGATSSAPESSLFY